MSTSTIPTMMTVATILNTDGSTAYQIQSQQYPVKEVAEAGVVMLNAGLMELGLVANSAIANGWNVTVGGQVTNQRLSAFIAEALERLRSLAGAVCEFYQELTAIIVAAETTLEEVDLNRLRKLQSSMQPFVEVQTS